MVVVGVMVKPVEMMEAKKGISRPLRGFGVHAVANNCNESSQPNLLQRVFSTRR